AEAVKAFATDPKYAPYAAARQAGSESRFQLIDDTDVAGTNPFLPKRRSDKKNKLLSDEEGAPPCRPLSNNAAGRPDCFRHPSTAAPRRSCWPTGSRPSCWSSWSTLGSRRRPSTAWSSAGAGSKSSACGLLRLAGGRSRSFDGPDPQARISKPASLP